jgi:hypothetical protein
VYAGLPAAVDARLARLVAHFDATVREVPSDQLPRGTGSQPPVSVRARVVVPADPRCLSLWVVLTPTPTIWLWDAGPRWFGLPHCTCDACDTDLEQLLLELDEAVERATEGMTRRVGGLRRLRLEDRGGSWASTAWFDRREARELGLRRGSWRWAPWPRRGAGHPNA